MINEFALCFSWCKYPASMRKNYTFKASYQVGEDTKELTVQAMNIMSAEKKANMEAVKSFGVSAQFKTIEKV